MIRYKTNKQAFIIAALVILLCLVCLTGATLALFTSDPNDGTIGIVTTSGDVEIDIVDTSGVTLQNRALAFMTTSGATDSDDVLFEPGATFYTQGFKIKNTGDIPVNFSLSVSKDDKIDMEEFAKAFELWIDVQVIEGNTYHYTIDGNVVLASVPYGNVGASFTVPDDVTILGQGDVYDGAVPVFSKSSPIESITLPEGLVEIKARAITGVKTLTSINFPSTLKAIRAQALRQTGMDELTVPANVEVIGEGASERTKAEEFLKRDPNAFAEYYSKNYKSHAI